MASGDLSDINECAKGCNENSLCSAFTIWHEDGKCYYFKPKDIEMNNYDKYGACFVKEEKETERKLTNRNND